MHSLILILGLVCLLAIPSPGLAASGGNPAVDPVLLSEGFLSHHPDINYRRKGLKAFEDGFLGDAVTYFMRSARYADKASQAMLAEMHWNGTGVAQDRALAYAWMDLAAERGYPAFIGLRERYWAHLEQADRQRVLEVGEPLYAEYGDEVAKPRLEGQLARGTRGMTGSRVGFRSALTIQLPGPGGNMITVAGDQYYADRYWKADHYWRWTDEVWSVPPTGRVDVGELERRSGGGE